MIDFRYHLVSIVAVFLALAIGLVVGATSLQGSVLSGLQNAFRNEQNINNALRKANGVLGKQVAFDQAYARAGSSYLVSNLLQGEQVVLVTAPNADNGAISGIISELAQSGATVTGQVRLTPQFFDVSQATESALTSLAQQLAPAGSGLPALSGASQTSGQEAAAQVLSYALMRKAGSASLSAGQIDHVVSGFGQQGFLQVQNTSGGAGLGGQADLAIVVIPAKASAPANVSGQFNMTLVTVAQQLQKAGQGAMLAGPLAGSGPGSAIDDVSSGAAGVSLNTVDNADTVAGQVIVMQVLRLMLNPHNSPVAYGVSTGLVPSPAPSTPPSPQTSPSASGSVSPGATPSPKLSVPS